MKTNLHPVRLVILLLITFSRFINAPACAQTNDPLLTSWFTTYSGKYARIYTNDISRTNGTALTTWSHGGTAQSLPAYCGVQEVDASTNWVYVRSTGFGSHVMGAWYLDANHTQAFPAWPTNQKSLYRFPRTTNVPVTKSLSGGGPIGMSVDGVALFNNWDANYWNGTTEVSSTGSNGFWNRDAYVNEGPSFDPGNAHQPGSGQYHYHANPPALRYLLGDHVDFNPVTKIYTESTNTPTKHSPILGWTLDGFPIYGPYGYSVSNNASSGIRRMISGFVLRNGQYGTSNLTANGRTTIPAWAARLYNVSSNILAGPAATGIYTLGRYMEDNDYLGDHGYKQGVDFDLDEYNGRRCVTPEFPDGTYAYFVSIAVDGTPVYPYNLGFGYYGSPTGGSVTAGITETVTTNFLGGANSTSKLSSPVVKSNKVTLVWSAVEGGTYQIESSTTLTNWTTNATGVLPNQITGSYTNTSSLDKSFYRVARTSLANYDPASTPGYGIVSVSPTSAARGSAFTLTINLDSSVNPPPQTAPINSVSVGAITVTGASNNHVSQTVVTSNITIPSGATIGAQTVSVVFPGPPGNPTQTVTYTLIGGFTIN